MKEKMGPFDVLTGLDRVAITWPGNIALQQLVSAYSKVYQGATQQQQHDIAAAVVQRIYDKGGSFYKKSKGAVKELPYSRAVLTVQALFCEFA